MSRPETSEYHEYYKPYVDIVPEGDIVEMMDKQANEIIDFFKSIPDEKGSFRYDPDKWSIKELLGHLTDNERIFGNRALRIARNDPAPLPGFNQDNYVPAGNFDKREIADIAQEFLHIRTSNVIMYKSFTDEDFLKSGTADGVGVSVRSIAYMLVGHAIHHINVINEKYL